ncbi:MAG: hypothetical protein QOI80_930 [Solirubrobacteraceae bacterium]|jgi:hypothetical protein|nr:hypothetical protein [Solirubrobacteraceae bacterium]
MLRIDESSKTLVAPEAAELVPDEALGRDELHALISAGWDAFAAEIGLSHVKAVAPTPAPGIDLLAVDTSDHRSVIVTIAEGHVSESLNRMLAAAATVAGWDADRLGAMHEALQPDDSPKHVVIGAEFDAGAVTLVDWLDRHNIGIHGFAVEVSKRGAERMLSVVRIYPAPTQEPQIVASVEPTNSAPPPPPPAPVEAA